MFSIGEFARLGRVSVRMLRHYDGIGLLRPAAVDPHGDGEAVVVHAGVTVDADLSAARDFAIVDLPAVATAATVILQLAVSRR